MARRLPPQPGEWIDRSNRLTFRFENETASGFHGDVISSALLANGRRVLGRSFKYHRPRGVLSLANHDANVLLTDGTETHIRGDVVAPEPGANYTAVNTLGGLRYDAMQALALLAPVLPVGFYYKVMTRPRWLFPLWEKLIRASAGLGRIRRDAPPQRVNRQHNYCDVLIVGAGPAGLAAAAKLAATPLKIIVADENARAGGSLHDLLHADPAVQTQCREALDTIAEAANIELLCGHFAAGYYPQHSVPLVGTNGITTVHARAVIFATGVYEQPAVFRNNDLPGVMLGSAAARLVHRYAVAPAETACVLAGNNDAYDNALNLAAAGLSIAAIVDLDDPSRRDGRAERALAAGIQVIGHSEILTAEGQRDELAAVEIRNRQTGARQALAVDGLLMSVGWAPAAGLLHQAGVQLTWDEQCGQVVPATLPPGIHCAGRVNGVYAPAARITDGRAAAAAAAAELGVALEITARPTRTSVCQSHPYPVTAHPRGKEFVDFDEDLQINDLRTAWREGFDSVELLKRYSTIGMGPSQGKTSNMNGVRILARLNDTAVGVIGTTTPRPFIHPVPLRQLAGRRMRRQWRTPMHEFHAERDADLKEAGTWKRPMSYTTGSPAAAVHSEYAAVRGAAGLIDVSTLGKIEIVGPDANNLLEFAYTCSFARLKVGMTRYIFMVDGSGTLVDDGVAARFADDHLYVTATSSHAQAVVRQLQLIADQLDLNVVIADRTFQVGAMNLAGPAARNVLADLTDMELDDAAFPYLAVRTGSVAGVEARLLRVGFVGELGYEIHAPATSCRHLWDRILVAGAGAGIRPFGVEAQRLLRLEKGHLIFGQDTDGTTNPYEVGLGWGVTASKARFNGKHALAELKQRVSRRLVGFGCHLPPGATLHENNLVIHAGDIAGRVTSTGYSPHCGETIGLALVDNALTEPGTTLSLRLSSGDVLAAEVKKPPFYDPDNLRQQC